MATESTISPFEFFGPSRIVFGRGKFAQATELAAGLGKLPMIIYNGPGVIDRLTAMLPKAIVRRQRGEPTVVQIDEAVAEASRANCDSVIGLGGGSAIDAAKAVAALLSNGGSPVDYMEVVGKGQKITKPSAPWMAIPTTAGTGAEATRNAVIGLPEKKFKASIRSELLLPRIALVDAELGVSVPPGVTASSGMDALCQVIESYTSIGANEMTDVLALRGIEHASRTLLAAFHDGKNVAARECMALAALLSGITLTSAGLGAVHGFAAPIGANFPIPHGTVCAALLPHIVATNVQALRAKNETRGLKRYADVGRRLPDLGEADDRAAIDGLVRFLFNLVQDLKIPPLKDFGMSQGSVKEMVGLARKASSMKFNPVVLTDEELSTALLAAIEGGGPIDG
jgi:alcohol dehydrogenase class IV